MFWQKTPKEGDHLKDLGIDGRIIVKRILKKYSSIVLDCILLAQNKYQWQSY
jgi:hypothetical protein